MIFSLFKNVFIKNLVVNIKTNKFLFIFSVFLILVIFIGSASAASDDNNTLSQSIDEVIDYNNNEILAVEVSSLEMIPV